MRSRSVNHRMNTIEDAKRIARQQDGRCLSTRYVSNSAKMFWMCNQGHRWEATYANIQRGKWCPYYRGFYRTIKDMQAMAAKRAGRCLSKMFAGMNKKLRWQCR